MSEHDDFTALPGADDRVAMWRLAVDALQRTIAYGAPDRSRGLTYHGARMALAGLLASAIRRDQRAVVIELLSMLDDAYGARASKHHVAVVLARLWVLWSDGEDRRARKVQAAAARAACDQDETSSNRIDRVAQHVRSVDPEAFDDGLTVFEALRVIEDPTWTGDTLEEVAKRGALELERRLAELLVAGSFSSSGAVSDHATTKGDSTTTGSDESSDSTRDFTVYPPDTPSALRLRDLRDGGLEVTTRTGQGIHCESVTVRLPLRTADAVRRWMAGRD
jgi:hypothetical protein